MDYHEIWCRHSSQFFQHFGFMARYLQSYLYSHQLYFVLSANCHISAYMTLLDTSLAIIIFNFHNVYFVLDN